MNGNNPQGDNAQNGDFNINLASQFGETPPATTTTTPVTTTPVSTGGTINDEGNLVDGSGTVIMTKEAIAAKLGITTPPPVDNGAADADADTSEYDLDAQGNLLKDGVLFKTKGSFTQKADGTIEYEDQTAIVNDVIQVAKQKGFQLTDENGAPLVFEDTTDGILNLAEAMAAESYHNEIENFFGTYPIVADIVKHLQRGGDINNFLTSYVSHKDYSKVQIAPEDVTGKKEIIKDYLTKVANNPADIVEYMIKAMDASGDIDVQFEKALGGLANWQKETAKASQKAKEEAIRAENARTQEHWDSVNAIIKKGNIGDLNIPDKDKDNFFKFIALQADKKGNTAAVLKYEALSLDQKLAIDYLLYKDFNLDEFIKMKTVQAQVQTLRDKKVKVVKVGNGPTSKQVNGANTDINITNLS